MSLSKMQELLPNEAVALQPGYFLTHPTNKVSEIQQLVRARVSHDIAVLMSDDGLECQVLRFNTPEWKSGRLRLILLFEEDAEVEEDLFLDDELDKSLCELQRIADS